MDPKSKVNDDFSRGRLQPGCRGLARSRNGEYCATIGDGTTCIEAPVAGTHSKPRHLPPLLTDLVAAYHNTCALSTLAAPLSTTSHDCRRSPFFVHDRRRRHHAEPRLRKGALPLPVRTDMRVRPYTEARTDSILGSSQRRRRLARHRPVLTAVAARLAAAVLPLARLLAHITPPALRRSPHTPRGPHPCRHIRLRFRRRRR